MNSLIIYPSPDTPEIQFHQDGNLLIKGISIPENVHSFYKEIFDWIEVFKQNLPAQVILNLHLEYMNTSSIKTVVSLIKLLIIETKDSSKFSVNWICDPDDDELLEEGELLQECVNYPFNFVSIKEN